MATTPLRLISWSYNDDNPAAPFIVGTFEDAPASDDPNAADYQPMFTLTANVIVQTPKKGAPVRRQPAASAPVQRPATGQPAVSDAPRPEPQKRAATQK